MMNLKYKTSNGLRGVLIAALLGACALSSACSAESAEEDAAGISPGTPDMGSDSETGVALEAVTLALRVVPDEDSGLPTHHVTELAVAPGATIPTVFLEQQVRVTGVVTYGASGDEARATLTFRQTGGISGLPALHTVDTGVDGANEPLSTGEFIAWIPAGNYQVTVRAEDESVPPLRVAELDATASLRFDPQLPAPDTLFVVQGSVVRQRPGDETPVPLHGVRVVLTSPTTGQVVSTEGETAEGNFSVRLAPIEGEYELQVTPTSDGEPVPDLAVGPVLVEGSVDLGELIVGEWADALAVTGMVVGSLEEQAADEPVEGATLFFEQELESGTFQQVALAGAGGMYSATLLPGEYVVTLVPPSGLEFGADTLQLEVDDSTASSNFELGPKPSLFGSVSDPVGEAVVGAAIVAEPISYAVDTLALGPAATNTEGSGLYLVRVHPGRHRVMVLPQEGAGVAPHIRESIAINADQAQAFDLRWERLAEGQVLTSAGEPLAEATVEVYVYTSGEPILFDAPVTDELGRFTVNLPTID